MVKKFEAGFFDVIVVGAGHAGVEAGLAAARMGAKTLMLTINLDMVAFMPCNPSVGGPAKGIVVREIDVLGGQMGRTIDKTHIQMRMLNTGKGPAVRALRAQADKVLYQQDMKETIENLENGLVVMGAVNQLVQTVSQVIVIICSNPEIGCQSNLKGATRQKGINELIDCLDLKEVVVTNDAFHGGRGHLLGLLTVHI